MTLDEAIQEYKDTAEDTRKNIKEMLENEKCYTSMQIKLYQHLECEYSQLVDWLTELKMFEDGINKIMAQIDYFHGCDMWPEANGMEYALELLGVHKGQDGYEFKVGDKNV